MKSEARNGIYETIKGYMILYTKIPLFYKKGNNFSCGTHNSTFLMESIVTVYNSPCAKFEFNRIIIQ